MVCETCYRAGRAETDSPLEQLQGPILSIAAAKAAAEEGMKNAMALDSVEAGADESTGADAAATRAADVERLALELETLKEKWHTGSRLEACLLELDDARKAAAKAAGADGDGERQHGSAAAANLATDAAASDEADGISDEARAAQAAEVERLATELVGLKEKHSAGSRLEACLLELDQVRKAARVAAMARGGGSNAAVTGANAAGDDAATDDAAGEAAAAARAAELDQLATELNALQEKHGSESRLTATLLELNEVRQMKAARTAELEQAREQLAATLKRAEAAEAAVKA